MLRIKAKVNAEGIGCGPQGITLARQYFSSHHKLRGNMVMIPVLEIITLARVSLC
jgi:hypothetical protein